MLGRDDLAAVPPDDWGALRLELHPSVRVLDLALNTPAVWKALDEDRAPPAVEQSPCDWLIWRQAFSPHFRSLESDECASLRLLADGACFGELCEALEEGKPETQAVAQAAELLSRWLADGLIAGYRLGPGDGP